jgi:glycosyltransferase involved in cell wall biosynthesis
VRDWLWEALEAHDIKPVLLTTDGSFDLKYLRGIAALIRRHRPDLIQTHLFASSVYASVAAVTRGLPVVCTFHGQNDVPPVRNFAGRSYGSSGAKPNRHVFVSEALRSWFPQHATLKLDRTQVIRNGIDCEHFRPARDETLRIELGAQPGEWLIGAVGNLRAPKNYPAFLRVAAILSRKSPRYKFVIVGAEDRVIRPQLEMLRQQLGLNNRLRFAGFEMIRRAS